MVCVYTLGAGGRPAVDGRRGSSLVAALVVTTALLQERTTPVAAVRRASTRWSTSGSPRASARWSASARCGCPRSRSAPPALEGELAREAELAAAEERTRIARELHDVVAHGLSLMVVQAEAAEEMLARSPEAAGRPLHRVQETGRQSLAEMRRLLGVLRAADDGPPSTAPQPSLRRLPELVREAADLGLPRRRRP